MSATRSIASLATAESLVALPEAASRPHHVAVIMDGNGRWAAQRGLPRSLGHRQGAEAARRAVESAIAGDVAYLTLFGFSSENWKRPSEEIDDLMGLLKYYLAREVAALHREGVRFRVIGDRSRLDRGVLAAIEEAERLTAANRRLSLAIALSYGARAEIAAAARRAAAALAAGELLPEELTETRFAAFLETADMPDPDLLIRTGGEKRISNFLLWQCAYAEFVFLDVFWPDFAVADFNGALEEFARRSRRYGALR